MFFNDFGLPGLVWRRLGGHLGRLGGLLRHPGGLLSHLGLFWRPLGECPGPLGPSWRPSGAIVGSWGLWVADFPRRIRGRLLWPRACGGIKGGQESKICKYVN